jgi:iron complex outermembrane receptor protein
VTVALFCGRNAIGLSGVALLLGSASPVLAQTTPATTPAVSSAPANDEGDNVDEEIVVNGQRQKGTVIGDIAPDEQYSARDIRAMGVSSLSDVLTELGGQLQSDRGRGGEQPVVLLNGKRIASFAEIRNFPPEALLRVDILPEEVALKYGYDANQRVINFVLRPRFRATMVEAGGGGPTDGGRQSYDGKAIYLRIQGESRLSLEGSYSRDTALRESDRDIISPALSRPYSLGGNITAPMFGAEIDPALSGLAGQMVTVVPIPGASTTGVAPLAAFVPGVNTASTTDIRPYRTLLAANQAVSLAASLATTVLGTATTFSAGLDTRHSQGLLGLGTTSLLVPAGNPFSPFGEDVLINRYTSSDAPLRNLANSRTGRLGMTMNGRLSGWNWTLTVNASHAEAETRTDRGVDISLIAGEVAAGNPDLNPFGPLAVLGTPYQSLTSSRTNAADATLVTNGALFSLPAGDFSTTLRAQVQTLGLSSESLTLGIANGRSSTSDLSRTQGNFQANFDLPLTSVRNNFLAGVGDLSANFNVSANTLSDFGTLFTYGYGLKWAPITAISFLASVTEERSAPTVQQLGNPVQQTPNVRTFDYTSGQTVDITQITGGNPGLIADHRRVMKLGLTVKPLPAENLTVSANYIYSRINNPIAAFPTATAALEGAFPDRFVRDAFGDLVSIDSRPVNFALSKTSSVRLGLNFIGKLKASPAEQAAADARRAEFMERMRAAGRMPGGEGLRDGADGGRPGGGPDGGRPRGGGPDGGGRGGGGRGGGGTEGRYNFSVYYTYQLTNEILVRGGGPVLDLLNGSAIGNGGGQSRHRVQLQAGVNKAGLGARLSLNWSSGTQVIVDPTRQIMSPNDLTFSDLGTIDLRLFADLSQQRWFTQKSRFFRGSRVSIDVKNIANAKLDVRNRAGMIPLGYLPDQNDPLGRTLMLSFRKLFF